MSIAHRIRQAWLGLTSRSSAEYWERRYQSGMDSGPGSHGELAAFKAKVLNDFVQRNDIQSAIEFGCGDGRQLALANYPKYLGLDVSSKAVEKCMARFGSDPSKSFLWYEPQRTQNLANFIRADLTLSLDVIYHLLEDSVYDAYLRDLFGTSERFVVIYSSDRTDHSSAPHVRHRKFTEDVAVRMLGFRLKETIPNSFPGRTFADFFIFERELRAD